MSSRYRLAPWMADYDRLGHVWHPYVMAFHTPNYRTEAVNTDERGFRHSTRGGAPFSNFQLPAGTSTSLVVGGSVAFGFGASADATTLPSLLNEVSDSTWLNYGGNAFSSTQELLLFLFHHAHLDDIRRVVLFSGLNELIMTLMGIRPAPEYGPFFYHENYDARMNRKRLPPVRKALKALLGPLAGEQLDWSRATAADVLRAVRAGGQRRAPRPADDRPTDPATAVGRYRENLLLWKRLTRSIDTELVFVLQPLFSWIEKDPSSEERELFSQLDEIPSNTWPTVRDRFTPELHRWYADELRGLCERQGIAFHDSNEALARSNHDGKWLFVDRAHMSDDGNRILRDQFTAWGIQS